MKRPILHAGLIVGMLAMGQSGCHQARKSETVTTAKPTEDPTAWSDKDLTRGDTESGSSKAGLPESNGLKGTLSSEAQSIEKSLGIGK